MAMSVDGLVSGLNTTEMVNQLMQVEALPQTALKNKVTAQNKAVTAYQDINTKLAAMTTAAKALESGDSWNPVKATSSSDAAIVTTTASARPGSITFKVEGVAAAHTVLMSGRVSSPTDANLPVITGTSFTAPGADGTPVTVTPATRSLTDVAAAINDNNLAYRATVVQTAPAQYTLQLTSVKAGAAGSIDPTGIPDNLGIAEDLVAATDAEITIGDPNGVGYTLKSATNTFTDVIPGVTVTLTKMPTDPDVTISTTADPGATADKVQTFVDTTNAALAQIKTATAAKSGSTAAGALAGDSTLRALSQEILSAVATGTGALSLPGNFAEVGITVERGGTLKFDRSNFTTAYETNPTQTREYFDKHTPVTDIHGNGSPTVFEPGWDTANGIARKLSTIGLKATEGLVRPDNPTAAREGIVTGLIKRRNDVIAALNDQVEAWDVRLETRRNSLQRQYSALEVALGKLKEQQSWLSGQLAGLS